MADLWQTYGRLMGLYGRLKRFYGDFMASKVGILWTWSRWSFCGNKLWGVRQVFVGYNNDVSNSINNVNDTIGDEIRLQHDSYHQPATFIQVEHYNL